MNKKVILTVVILVIIITLAVIGTSVLRGQKKVIIQGEVEASEIKISSKLAGRVEKMAVKEGQKVSKGDFLFAIATPEIDAKLSQAMAAKSAAKAQEDKAKNGARKQIIESAHNLWKQSEIALNLAKKSNERITNLFNEGVIPAQKRDEVKAQYELCKENEKIARSQYEMAKEGAQKEDIISATALVSKASGAIAEVESYLADASQYASLNGEISKIIANETELVSTGYPVVTIVDIDNPWIVFNVKETLLPQLSIGKKLDVYVPGLDKNIEVEVSYISVQAEYATWTATRSKGSFDIRTFEIRAYPTSKIDGLRVGMTVVADLESAKNE